MNMIKDYRKVIQLNASKEMVTSWWWGGRRLDQKILGKVMGCVFTCAEMGLSRAYVWWFGGSEGGPDGPVGYLGPSLRGTEQVDTK